MFFYFSSKPSIQQRKTIVNFLHIIFDLKVNVPNNIAPIVTLNYKDSCLTTLRLLSRTLQLTAHSAIMSQKPLFNGNNDLDLIRNDINRRLYAIRQLNLANMSEFFHKYSDE